MRYIRFDLNYHMLRNANAKKRLSSIPNIPGSQLMCITLYLKKKVHKHIWCKSDISYGWGLLLREKWRKTLQNKVVARRVQNQRLFSQHIL